MIHPLVGLPAQTEYLTPIRPPTAFCSPRRTIRPRMMGLNTTRPAAAILPAIKAVAFAADYIADLAQVIDMAAIKA
jgi:hypothetical protein